MSPNIKNKNTFIVVLVAVAVVFWFLYTTSAQNNQQSDKTGATQSVENDGTATSSSDMPVSAPAI